MKIKLSGKRRAVNIIIAVLSVCCFAIGGICVYAENILGNIHYETVDTDNVSDLVGSGNSDFDFGNISADNLYHDSAVMNIVLFSLDNYQKNDVTYGRSDSMMLVSIDTRNEEIKLTSYMRDLFVEVPGYGFDRLNAAFAYGGPTLAMAAMEHNFRVDIDRYVIIDFQKFVEIIDTIGGVDLEITQDEADIINKESGEKDAAPVSAGMMHLTGKQARMYSRIRKIDSDFNRTERQRKVVSAAIEKLKNTDLFTLNSYLTDILGMITTNLTKDEVLGLAANLMSYLNYDIRSFRLPVDGGYYDETVSLYGGSAMVLVPNLEVSVSELTKFVYGADNIPTLKSSYTLPQYGGTYQGPAYVASSNESSETTDTGTDSDNDGADQTNYNDNDYDGNDYDTPTPYDPYAAYDY